MRGESAWHYIVIWYSVAFVVLCGLVALNWR